MFHLQLKHGDPTALKEYANTEPPLASSYKLQMSSYRAVQLTMNNGHKLIHAERSTTDPTTAAVNSMISNQMIFHQLTKLLIDKEPKQANGIGNKWKVWLPSSLDTSDSKDQCILQISTDHASVSQTCVTVFCM